MKRISRRDLISGRSYFRLCLTTQKRLDNFGEAEREGPEVIRGEGAYSAVVGRDVWSDDECLAETFSGEFGGTVYLLRLCEEREAVWDYEAGELVREVRDDPFRLAASLWRGLPGGTDGPPVSEAVTLLRR